ncbi:MAG TPA: sensor histidine kinase [Euzebya sp.]|nr:sensor histidine kinase [Euzebya sp.]
MPGRVSRHPLIHLVHLVHLGWQPGFDPTSSRVDWAVVVGVAALFVPLYLASFSPDHSIQRRALIGTVVLGTVATPLNIGAAVLFVYAAVMAADLYGRGALRWHQGLSGLLVALAVISTVPFPYRVYGVLPSFVVMWIAGQQAVEDAERRRDAERLRVDSVRAEHLAAADERERIARDLHDLLGQSLTGLVVRAQLVQSLAGGDPAAVTKAAADLEETARTALEQVRSAVGGLREISLADEVDGARRTLAAAGLAVTIDVPTGVPNPLVERSLALALREAVTNVVRHAQARDCRIDLSCDDGIWRLEVSDDGVGTGAPEGNGLRGMRERIAAIGGAVERRVGRGTTVVVTVPA